MGSLSNLYISQSYQSLIHLATNNTASATLIGLQDGLGNSIGVSVNTGGNLFLSGSLTASLQQGYVLVGDGSNRTILVPTSSFTDTFNSSSLVTTSSFNAYTASNDSKVNNLINATASYAISSSVAAVDAAQQLQINSLISATGSYANSASVAAVDAAQQSQINSLIAASGSYLTSSVPLTSLNTFTASQLTINSGYNTYTASNDAKWNTLGALSGSFITESETASFARTNIDNNFSANQTFTNITAVSASFTYVQITYETASVIYSSGSNQFGDELTDIQTLSGSVKIQGGLTINGVDITGSLNNLNSFTASALTNSASVNSSLTNLNQFTSSQETKNTTLATYTASVNSSLTNINTFTASNGNTSLNAFTASQETKNITLASVTSSLNSATSSLFTSTSLSLITASFDNGTRNLTFTKGNTTQFSVNIPDASGSAGDFVTTSSFNAYTASSDQKVNSLISATGSYATTGSNTFTGNQTISSSLFISGNINMVNGADIVTHHVRAQGSNGLELQTSAGAIIVSMGAGGGTQAAFVGAVTANSISASTINGLGDPLAFSTSVDSRLDGLEGVSGSFATTGSNSFVGNQTITGSLIVNYSPGNNPQLVIDSNTNEVTLRKSAGVNPLLIESTVGGVNINSNETYIGDGANIFYPNASSNQNTLKTTNITGTFTASLQEGYAWVGNASGVSSLVATSSFGGALPTGTISGSAQITALGFVSSSVTASSLVTASFSGNTLTFTKGDTTTFGIVLPDVSGSTINTGSFATTGSNVFTGIQTFQDAALNATSLVSTSGSLMLVAKSYTSASSHISGTANLVNLIFKNNSNTADTIVSGSGNMFINPAAPTAGFKRYVGGGGNLMLNASNVPLISSSMAFSPTMNLNYFGGNANTLTMRGPVSSSTYTISANVVQGAINIGSSAANHAEKAVAGFLMTGNSVNGTFNFVANKALLTQANTITNNLMAVTTLTAASSSIIYTGNIGGITVTNNASGGLTAFGANAINVSQNLFVGSNNSITTTGSQDPGDTGGGSYLRQIEQSQIFGNSNGVNLPYAPTGSNSLNATMIAGYSLGVTGSNPSSFSTLTQLQGSAFFGRWNAQNGNRAQSAQTVFAVGTGTAAFKKTGFLIDSGSNTYVEGTLNVSGSSTFTGSVNVSGSSTFNGTQTITGSLTVSASISLNGLTLTRGPGNNNVGIGVNILQNAVSGGNVAIGNGTLNSNTSGTDNIALGDNSLLLNTSGDRNMAIGSNTLEDNTTGTLNVAIGNATLASLVDGNANIGIGFESLKNQTTSDNNTAIGRQTLNQNISGSGNIAIGASAGYNETGSNNLYITNNNFGSINADRSGSLMWGKMDNTTANQTLQINARTRFTNEILFTTGSNKQAGTAVLDGANPGTVTVSNSLVTADSIILLTKQTLTNSHMVAVTAKSGGSFTITSNGNGDADTVGWFIINNS